MHQDGFDHASVKALAKELEDQLKRLKSWIDNNPDYLLIMCSDHGVDGPGNLLHGHPMPGNDGYLMFYNPNISPTEHQKIDVVDVAATISKYLRGVSIPGTSVGRAMNFYGPYHATAYPKVLQQNLQQLVRLSKSRGESLPAYATRLGSHPDAWERDNMEDLLRAVIETKVQRVCILLTDLESSL
jgi:hypothetical protein